MQQNATIFSRNLAHTINRANNKCYVLLFSVSWRAIKLVQHLSASLSIPQNHSTSFNRIPKGKTRLICRIQQCSNDVNGNVEFRIQHFHFHRLIWGLRNHELPCRHAIVETVVIRVTYLRFQEFVWKGSCVHQYWVKQDLAWWEE